MLSLNQTLQALQPYILHQRLLLPPGRDFSQLYILGEEPVDQKFSLYIGTPDSFVRAADALSADKVGFTFVRQEGDFLHYRREKETVSRPAD